MSDANATAQLKKYLEPVSLPLELAASLDDPPASAKMCELLSEIATLSPLVSVVEESNPHTPSFVIRRVGTEIEVRFAGLPMGHEFSSSVLALVQVDGHAPRLGEETAEAVRRLEGGEFIIYMLLTCQNYPIAVQALNTMSVFNPRVRHVAVEGGAFKDEVEALGIKAVPAIYKDGWLFGQGRMDVADFVARLDSGAGVRIAEALDAKDPFEVLVVEGGPVGATTAIYSARKTLRIGLVTARFGGQVLDTIAIENSISMPHTEGPRLGAALEEYVHSHDVDITMRVKASALHPAGEGGLIAVDTEGGGTLRARSVVLATGAYYRTTGVPGEEEYRNKGMTFCPHCDGPPFKDRSVAVIGGGNSGTEAAIDLAQVASHVTVVELLDVLKADAVLVNTLCSLPNVDVLTSTRVVEVVGDGSRVIGLDAEDRTSGQVRRLDLEGVLAQIGPLSGTGWLDGVIERNRVGEIVIDQRGATSLPGVFAAGDCANTLYKRVVISLGSGVTAALFAFDHLIRSREEVGTPTTAIPRA